MLDFVLDQIASYIVGQILLWATPMITIILARIRRLSVVYSFVLALASFAIMLIIINQAKVFNDAHKPPLGERSAEEIESTLNSWAYKQGLSVSKDPQPNTRFSFVARDPQGRVVIIQQRLENPPWLVVGARLGLGDPQNKELWDKTPKSVQNRVLTDLGIEMARLGIYYEGTDINNILMYSQVPLDNNMNEWVLSQQVLLVRRALVLAQLIITNDTQ